MMSSLNVGKIRTIKQFEAVMKEFPDAVMMSYPVQKPYGRGRSQVIYELVGNGPNGRYCIRIDGRIGHRII